MVYTLLADFIVAVHFCYVAFVVVGQLLIVAGLLLRWGWVRNLWFRCLHLLAIGIVAFETILGIKCPLTEWEDQLLGSNQGTFIGRLLHNLFIFDDLPFDHWAFRAAYISFAVLVLATFVLAPPRLRRRPSPPPGEGGSPAAASTPFHHPSLGAAARSETTKP